ncbi:hypothetical protein GW17_00021784 [Ensete ventricosum]|uniref:Aldehyde oxidase/xanthine dehydrogenase second molybdopterin binding domain-containing protein n=1 Tax=Ensete ventricosum TaxID=4639 RepID=A0A444EVN6_ENSVE|nr:hypothetical protein B296_00023100 [Ensete ventricosum]RWW14448.1 hypothetical protein GW17_00021784 [Ensete ventricosum]
MIIQSCTLSQLWDELKTSCDFVKARANVNHFNLHNRWRKRGVAMVPTKFGISFTAKHMNQVPNASPTAASASSDLYGAAVLDACEQIKARMQCIAATKTHSSFAEVMCCSLKLSYLSLILLVRACYLERIDLSAHGFYITPNIGFDWKVGKGIPFNYFTYGAAFAEVEIDTLTGDFYTREADIIMDLGHSLNPAIDVGQVYVMSTF